MKLERQLNQRVGTIDQQGMKLEKLAQLPELSQLEKLEQIRTTNIDQRGMRLEQQLLTNRELN